jgi:hypothetical protein
VEGVGGLRWRSGVEVRRTRSRERWFLKVVVGCRGELGGCTQVPTSCKRMFDCQTLHSSRDTGAES